MADAHTDPLLGQLIDGKYRLVSQLGAGGMGKVYRAEQVALGRSVAVKVLDASPGHRDADPAVERRFFLEASLSAKLAHPNVITVHDYGRVETEDGTRFYLVMELLEGETLHRRLQRGPTPMPAHDAVAIGIEIARGLRAAHKAGLVHRDLKPANVMLVPSDEGGSAVKILDFGLVKQVEGELREDITQEGTFLGSPRYMAPEQVSAGAVDHRCDLYALGVILFQCLCGSTPFDGKSAMDVLVKHINAPVPWMREKNPNLDVSPGLEAIVRRLLEKNPSARFPDAESVVSALRDVAATFRSDATVASRSQSGAMRDPRLSMVTPQPTQPVPAASIATEPSGTIAGTSVSTANPAPAAKKSPVVLFAVGGLAVLGAVAVVVLGATRRPAQSDARATAQPPVVASNNAATAAPNAAPAPARGSLRFDSNPTGASIRENGVEIGTTPYTILIEPSGATRRFEVVMEGYATFRHEQAPTSERVTVVAALTAERAEPTTAQHHGAQTNGRRPSTTGRRPSGNGGANASTGTGGGGEEIRLER